MRRIVFLSIIYNAQSFITTTYHYNAITGSVTTGAGRVGSVVNVLTGGTATINYSYDEWGRAVTRNVDGSTNNNVATTFDSLGRVKTPRERCEALVTEFERSAIPPSRSILL
jgi:hypothetical protein